MLNVVIFGPPGSGKGTQSKLVAARFDFMHLSTGDLFRKEISHGTAMGELLSKFIDRGLLVPDSIVLRELFKAALSYRNFPGLVFDGFPRTVYQAQLLHRVLGNDIQLVISIEVPEEELLKRILKRSGIESRSDDNADAFHQRYLQYEHLTLPVMKYYKRRGLLNTIDGTREVNEIFADVAAIIDNHILHHI
jgi:adenylate kinase